jgi:endonuclease-3
VARRDSIKSRARVVAQRLAVQYPGDAAQLCALTHDGAFQLLVATILSAQTTDARVNTVTPALFAAFPGPEDLAGAGLDELEGIIRPTGFFHAKARSLTGMAQALVERFDGAVPRTIDELVTLPGVGRKTANVVLSVAFGLPGLPVDTHVGRLARRLGLSAAGDPVVVEGDLCALVPPEEWGALSVRLILHGRNVCDARRPRCDACQLADVCPRAGVGSVAPPSRPTRRAKD